METVFQLKGSLFTLSVLQMLTLELDPLEAELTRKIEQAPKFFHYAPVVIDFRKLDITPTTHVNFDRLNTILRNHKLIPIGVRGGNQALYEQAQTAGFAVLSESQIEPATPETTHNPADIQTDNTQNLSAYKGTRLITEPVRSGQQIYAQGGDLIVVASVSPGAELLADGNIHVYGPLRGRALAGVNGDTRARIFCQRLEAELVSIAGQYKVFEDISTHQDSGTKQLYLENNQLVITTLAGVAEPAL
jgi:septum site-determining protein MinC